MKKTFTIVLLVLFSVILFSACFSVKNYIFNNTEKNIPKNDSSNGSESEVTIEDENKNQDGDISYSYLRYLAIGDSITYGCCTSHPTQYENGGYPALVSNLLGLKTAINAGVPGNQVDAMVDRISSMPNGVSIISFMGGINDFNNNVPLGNINDFASNTFYGRLNILSEELIKKYPDSFIFYMTPFPSSKEKFNTPNFEGYVLEDYANAVIAVAKKYNSPVLDIYRQGKFELEMYNSDSDGVHPSDNFFESYTAPQIAEFIKQNYK